MPSERMAGVPSELFDVIVVGGSHAGLSAALALVRARKRVLVIDSGQRRNRFVASAHNLLGQDGRPPNVIVRAGRAEVAGYPTATFIVDALGQSTVPGVFAAGDAAQLDRSLAGAVASARMVGTMAHHSLLSPTH